MAGNSWARKLVPLALCLTFASPPAAHAAAPIVGAQLLSSTQIPTGTWYDGALVFGLSGIDYDAASNQFISQRDNYLANTGNNGNPVAFTLRPVCTAGQPGFGMQITGVNMLGGAQGISSLESIRYDPRGNGVWLSSEGPNAVYHVASNGTRTQIALPDSVAGRTPSNATNSGLEGMTFAPNSGMWVARENAMTGDATNLIRLSNIAQDGSLLKQFAYTLDIVSATRRNGETIANPPSGGVGNNGVSEILAVDDSQFLVMERGWDGIGANANPQGVAHNYVRIYSVDMGSGSDVGAIRNLDGSLPFTALSKTLLFDSQSPEIAAMLNTYDTKVDNLEGMSFGPTLQDGRRSLVLVSDNNNSGSQRKTQFLVFGLSSGVPEPSSWGMMIVGFGIAGGGLRRRRRTRAPLQSQAR